MAVSVTDPDSAAVADAIRVSVPGSGLRQNLRAISIVWRREIIRFKSDRLRAVTSLVQPVLFLFVLGTGLSSLASRGMPPGIDFSTFIYPGVLSMSVLFTAIFSAASIVWDREFGFLREMLVAPVSRSAIVIGKCLGGATVSTFQGIFILALAGLAHVPYDPILLLTVIGELLLLSFTLTAFGVMMAARITQIQAFMALTQMLVMPLFLPVGRALPAPRAARLAGRAHPGRPDHRCRVSHAAHGLQSPEHLAGRERGAVAARHLGRVGGPHRPVAGQRRGDGRGRLGMAIAEFQRTE
jgi:ABC-2 type transport system permease protein